MRLLDLIRLTDFVLLTDVLFSCPNRLYTISGSLSNTLPPKEAHIEMWYIVTVWFRTFRLPRPLHMTHPDVVTLAFVVGGSWVLHLCVWSHPGTSRIPRDFSLTRGAVFSVVEHERYVLCSTLLSSITGTPSHTCYWLIVVVQLESDLRLIWL